LEDGDPYVLDALVRGRYRLDEAVQPTVLDVLRRRLAVTPLPSGASLDAYLALADAEDEGLLLEWLGRGISLSARVQLVAALGRIGHSPAAVGGLVRQLGRTEPQVIKQAGGSYREPSGPVLLRSQVDRSLRTLQTQGYDSPILRQGLRAIRAQRERADRLIQRLVWRDRWVVAGLVGLRLLVFFLSHGVRPLKGASQTNGI
jgi:hypothetical protein